MLYYAVFRTQWGYFGLAGCNDAVWATSLPRTDREATQARLLAGLPCPPEEVRFERGLFRPLQRRIMAYFEGENVDFSTDPAVCLDRMRPFGRKVLRACRRIAPGQTATYGTLAARVGSPAAARAVGSTLAANPIPLIIPCHRVLRNDGGLGGFTAAGGTATKQRLLQHERAACGTVAT
ncbi:MAG: methylated-DNA--[protein]-cysteine S-methyltransferase [Sedimentisphaerales bacterium]|nr:methylated-DNA--[protein]-cysteine S-methyltransferase [Sedimentisphaerales bacterium]